MDAHTDLYTDIYVYFYGDTDGDTYPYTPADSYSDADTDPHTDIHTHGNTLTDGDRDAWITAPTAAATATVSDAYVYPDAQPNTEAASTNSDAHPSGNIDANAGTHTRIDPYTVPLTAATAAGCSGIDHWGSVPGLEWEQLPGPE